MTRNPHPFRTGVIGDIAKGLRGISGSAALELKLRTMWDGQTGRGAGWIEHINDDRGKPHHVRFRHDAARHFPELAGYPASVHPNGKRSIELPTSLFPAIRTAGRCAIRCRVFLDRESAGPARVERMPAADAMESLLADLPSYGAEVNALHEKTIHHLTGLPAWHLRYRTLEEGIRLLSEIPIPPE